jgi:hypothetical protein
VRELAARTKIPAGTMDIERNGEIAAAANFARRAFFALFDLSGIHHLYESRNKFIGLGCASQAQHAQTVKHW